MICILTRRNSYVVSSCLDKFKIVIHPDELISFEFEPLVSEVSQGLQKKYIPPHREFQIGCIRAYETTISQTQHQGALDEVGNSLESLQHVRIHLPQESSWSTITEGVLRRKLRRAADPFPQIRACATRGLSLTFVVEGEDYSWDPGLELDEDDETSEEELLEDGTHFVAVGETDEMFKRLWNVMQEHSEDDDTALI